MGNAGAQVVSPQEQEADRDVCKGEDKCKGIDTGERGLLQSAATPLAPVSCGNASP